jgi:hypothetical protein
MRSHGLTLRDAGTLVGVATGPGAVIGSLTSGWHADRLARRGGRWLLGIPLLGALLTFPFAVAFPLVPADLVWHLGRLTIQPVRAFMLGMSVFAMWWMAPSYACERQGSSLLADLSASSLLSNCGFGNLEYAAESTPRVTAVGGGRHPHWTHRCRIAAGQANKR